MGSYHLAEGHITEWSIGTHAREYEVIDRETLRENAAILRRLGYISVADMMRRLARKAKPRPMSLPPKRARHHGATDG
jgi:hypothetical protein